MKQLFILATILIGLNAQAQIKDSVIVGQDTVLVPLGAIVINPIIVNAQGDSAFSLNFYAFDVKADTVSGCQTYITLAGKNGQSLSSFNQLIPSSVLNKWSESPAPIYDYILFMNPRFIRYTKQVNYLNKK